jgi:hypothetical protein
MPIVKRVRFLDPPTGKVLLPTSSASPVIPNVPPKYSSSSSSSSLSSLDPPQSATFPLYPVRSIYPVIRVHPSLVNDDQDTPSCFDISRPSSMRPPLTQPLSIISPASFHRPTKYVNPPPDRALLDEPATYPPLSSITLISDLLPWLIHVEASQTFSVPAVTIDDVLQTLLTNLYIPVTPREWACVPSATQALVTTTFYRRIESIPHSSLKESERRKGVRRMDFLLGRTRLAGFIPVADGHGVFVVGWRSA